MQTVFNTPKVAQILGIPERRIIDWCERGIIIADIQSAAGFASRREFSYAGVLQVALGLALQEKFHISRDFIKSIIKLLWYRDFFTNWAENKIVNWGENQVIGPPGFLLITNPHNPEKSTWLHLPSEDKKFAYQFSALWDKEADSALIIDLAPIKKQIDSKIAELG
jgi:hypothetical protein